MIYTLNIKRVGGRYLESFERTIEVSDEMTLGTLHDTIQELTGFDNDHLFTFFIARGPRGQRTSIVETGQWEEEQDRVYEIPLGEVFPLEQSIGSILEMTGCSRSSNSDSLDLKTRVLNIRRSSERSGLNLFSIQNKNKSSHQPLC